VLPDVASASVPWRFGLAYEEQPTGPSGPTGRILLETWDVDALTISLARRESHAFGNLIAVAYRRRPMLSAYPSAFPGEDVFAIAFNRLSSTGEGDVVYEEWNLTDGAFKVLWPVGWGWDNDADHRKPVPLLGREISLNVWFGRCYAEKSNGGDNCDLQKYVRKDAQTTDQRFTVTTADQLQRPAAAYQYDSVHDNVALTWEQLTDWNGLAPFVVRVWLRME
jgi:hypothetical protein